MNIDLDTVKQLKQIILNKNKRIICIEGKAASGKTTLARKLGFEVIHMDDFFLPDELRTKERLNEIGGNIDYDRFIKEVLINLSLNKQFTYQAYNCHTKTFNTKTCYNNSIVIIEGVYSYHPKFQKYYDYLIYCDIDKKTQLNRLKKRPQEIYAKFIDTWLELEEKYYTNINPKAKANIILF